MIGNNIFFYSLILTFTERRSLIHLLIQIELKKQKNITRRNGKHCCL
jgi:hypothetical protein